MVKVIRAKIKRNKAVCPNCGVVLEYEDEDLFYLKGGKGIVCPNCESDIIIHKQDSPSYPNDFEHYETDKNKVSDQEIQEMIDCVTKELSNLDQDDYVLKCKSGVVVIGFKKIFRDKIMVLKNYYKID